MGRFKRPLIYLGAVIVVALAIYCLTACGGTDNGTNQNGSDSKDLSAFTTTTLSGEEVDQSIFKDHKVTMVNFWATFCGPCINEMPDLAEIYNERKGADFNLIGIVMDVQEPNYEIRDGADKAAEDIINGTGADYMHLLLSSDIDANMTSVYDIQSIPTTFFVDSEGKVIGSYYVGSKSKADWESIIDEIAKEADSSSGEVE